METVNGNCRLIRRKNIDVMVIPFFQGEKLFVDIYTIRPDIRKKIHFNKTYNCIVKYKKKYDINMPCNFTIGIYKYSILY